MKKSNDAAPDGAMTPGRTHHFQGGLAGMPGSDRYFDLTLRILTLAVIAALLGCIAFLMHRWSQPNAPGASLVHVVQAPAPAVAVPLPARGEAAVQVLHAPGRIFRCEHQGQVTYSDQPCRDATPPR